MLLFRYIGTYSYNTSFHCTCRLILAVLSNRGWRVTQSISQPFTTFRMSLCEEHRFTVLHCWYNHSANRALRPHPQWNKTNLQCLLLEDFPTTISFNIQPQGDVYLIAVSSEEVWYFIHIWVMQQLHELSLSCVEFLRFMTSFFTICLLFAFL